MTPKVSIIIPTYNRHFYLEKAIRSIQAQDFKDFEIIVVDDGLIDETKQMMSRHCSEDKRIRYYYQENGGNASARNSGIKIASGEWLLFLDDDDMLADNALSFLTNKIQDYPQAGMIGGTIVFIDGNDNLITNQGLLQVGFRGKQGLTEGLVNDPYIDNLFNYYLLMGTYIIHRNVIDARDF